MTSWRAARSRYRRAQLDGSLLSRARSSRTLAGTRAARERHCLIVNVETDRLGWREKRIDEEEVEIDEGEGVRVKGGRDAGTAGKHEVEELSNNERWERVGERGVRELRQAS